MVVHAYGDCKGYSLNPKPSFKTPALIQVPAESSWVGDLGLGRLKIEA